MYRYSTDNRRHTIVFSILITIVTTALTIAPLGGAVTAYAAEDTGTEEPALIVTGDAESGSETETIINMNDTSPDEPDTSGGDGAESLDSEADTSEPETPATEANGAEDVDTSGDTPSPLIENTSPEDTDDTEADVPGDSVTTENTGTITNAGTTTAETGANSALGDGSVIVTGDAIAYANIVNVVNTNIFNSDGAIGFFNEILGVDSFDLRSAFDVFDETNAVSTLPCSPSVCDADAYTVTTNNTANITNDIVVRADTGGNVSGDDGTIYTGDAYAAANIFNLANTNITDSTYLLISFNNFGDYGGDIVLPGAEALNTLFSANGNSLSDTIASTNDATIENTVSATAETGGNDGSGGTIVTGDAYSDSSIQNTVNTNLFGGSDFVLVLRVHGDWAGEVFGLPEGIAWAETEHGIVLYNTNSDASGAVGGATSDTTNTATIRNNVSVFALTGQNRVGDSGTIQTGDAYAAANVTNVANTNILGQNWALLVFDIFGNWNGNLAFGRPDLWIGGAVSSPKATIMPGNEVVYTYTVTNNGDSTATDVTLDHRFDGSELVYASDSDKVQFKTDGAHGVWSLGTIAPHETKEISFKTNVHSELSRAKREIVSSATVRAHETDADTTDNTEYLSFFSGKNGGSNGSSKPAQVTLTKSSNVEAVAPGGSVDYTITITNNGGPLYKSLLRDVLRNEDGATTSEQYWDLGTIHAGETISVTYTMEFADDATIGTYTNSADVVGLTGHNSLRAGKSYDSPDATDDVFVGDVVPQVLGLSTTRCAPYLTSYLRYGGENNPEDVRRLQVFLNMHMGYTLETSGFFNTATEVAVRAFQSRYASDILNPWGLTRNSGHVYYTTQKKINEIQCNNEAMFPLSVAQFNEMNWFKAFARNAQSTSAYVPAPNIVYASDEITPQNADEEDRYIVVPIPSVTRTQTTTPKASQDDSFIESLILPIKRVLEWSKRTYLDNWF